MYLAIVLTEASCQGKKTTKKQNSVNRGFVVLTVMKRSIFWEIMPCNPFEVNQLFREICSFLLND